VEDAPSIERVAGIVRGRLHLRPAVVVSAMGKTTRNLLTAAEHAADGRSDEALVQLDEIRRYHADLAQQVIEDGDRSAALDKLESYLRDLHKLFEGISVLRELTPRSQDKILAYGELMSTAIVAEAFRRRGIPATLMDARELVITDERFTRAQPVAAITHQRINEQVRPVMESDRVPIIQGYIGSTRDGATTTLGFEGSDYTAALVGAGLGASDVQIWKDVSGLMTADPAIFAQARTVKRLSFAEAAELTFFGAKVLHPKAVHPARLKGIPVHLYNSKKPEAPGTLISDDAAAGTNVIKSIAYKRPLSILNVRSNRQFSPYDFLKGVFDVLDRERITPYIMATAEASVALALDASEQLAFLLDDLSHYGEVSMTHGKATISLVGENLARTPDVAAMVCRSLNGRNLAMIAHGASPINFTFVVDEEQVPQTIAQLHDMFFHNLDPHIFEGNPQ
jgi:aspartate kinase